MQINSDQIKEIENAYLASIRPTKLLKDLESLNISFTDWCRLGSEVDLAYTLQAFESANLKHHCRIITGILTKK